MNKRFLLAILLLLLLSTYNVQNHFNLDKALKIEKIIVENNFIVSQADIRDRLIFLYDSNILFFEIEKIKKELEKIDFIESFEIKTIYPNKIKIKIYEISPIAILQNKKNKYYYTENNKIINFISYNKFKNLPVVFGNQESFKILYANLKKIKFPINTIKTYHYFESKRWDLITKKNQTIKLPILNYDESLRSFINLKDKENFTKYKTFDYRINGQLILK